MLYPQRRDIKSVDDLNAATATLKSGDVLELKLCNPDPTAGTCTTSVSSVQIQK
jgi:hypothetical protein